MFHSFSCSDIGVRNCLKQTIKTNVIGTLNMLGLAKRVGARSVLIMPLILPVSHVKNSITEFILNCRILLTSTSEVYGDPLEHPQTEAYWGNVNPIGKSVHLTIEIYLLCFFINYLSSSLTVFI